MSSSHFPRAGWQAIYEIPLAVASYGLFRITRAVMGRLARSHTSRHPEERRTWKVFSKDLLNRPGALLFIATTAPRWNPHAVVATVGPVEAATEIAVNLSPTRSLDEWYIVVYSFPDHHPIASFSSFAKPEGDWARASISAPGSFLVSVRYYELEREVEFPAIEVDRQPAVAPRRIAAQNNKFYDDLPRRANFLYQCLGYHTHVMLRRRIFSTAWVRRTYLPVGNPESVFHYGTIRAGQRVTLNVNSDFFERFRVYLTIYSPASFPVLWLRLDERAAFEGPSSPVDGHFLLRLNGVAGSSSGWSGGDGMPGHQSLLTLQQSDARDDGSRPERRLL